MGEVYDAAYFVTQPGQIAKVRVLVSGQSVHKVRDNLSLVVIPV
jgi:hypothetical protein